MKRRLALLTALIVALALCVSSMPALAADQEVTLNWFSDVSGWGPANWTGVDSSPLLDAIKEQFGVTFEIEQPATDADTKLALMIATNDLPDLISITNSEAIAQLIESGYVWTIDEFVETYDPESHLLVDFPADVKKAVVDAYGDFWFFPSHMDSVDHRETFPLCSEVYVNNVVYGQNNAVMFNEQIMADLAAHEKEAM